MGKRKWFSREFKRQAIWLLGGGMGSSLPLALYEITGGRFLKCGIASGDDFSII
jgi:hypothetical protein